jgi:DNA-binding Lrp family transcriptional regulator
MRDILKILEQDARTTPSRVADIVAKKLATLDRVNATNIHFLLKKYKDDGDVFAEEETDQRLVVAL